MKLYQIHTTQNLALSIEEAWIFFSNPANLQTITPDFLKFRILTALPAAMYEGLIIHYKVSAIANIPMNWITEITHVRERQFFVDEQRSGPYKFWHHQHHFTPIENGVQMEDIVHYALPFGLLGRIVHSLLVKHQLTNIFRFRKQVLQERFGDV